MALPIEFSGKAQADLEDIAAFLHGTGSRSALDFLDELEASIASLSDYPERFSVVPELASRGLRRCVCGSYVIFYLVQSDTVLIVRVLHGERDIFRHLTDDL